MIIDNKSITISENDDLRSEYIRELVQEENHKISESLEVEIPKTIVQFWHDLENIPKDVQECLNTWKVLEKKGFKIKMFDNKKAREFINNEYENSYVNAFDNCHHPAMRCDFFRLCYIKLNGGFYIDADEKYLGQDCSHYFSDNSLKLNPLCYDIDSDSMVNIEDFIFNKKYSSRWIFYINNNPLVSPPAHPIISLALERSKKLLLENSNKPLEIQSTTGPGNLSASVVKYCIESNQKVKNFSILKDWESISLTYWPLDYRKDNRNWRLWNHSGLWKHSSFVYS